MGFAKPNYENNSNTTFAKRIKLADGDNIFRVVPPIKSCEAKGQWYQYGQQHFGYNIPNPKAGEKDIPAPWGCDESKDRRTGMIVNECPECKQIRRQKENLADLEAKAKAGKYSEADTEALLAPVKAWLETHNLDKKYYVNVKMQSGDFGMMGLPYTAYKALCGRIDEARAQGLDPIDAASGLWFNVKKTGKKFNTEYSCDFVNDTVKLDNGMRAEVKRAAPLSDADYEEALKSCGDLILDPIRKITLDQKLALVACGNSPEDVSRILGMGQRRERSPSPAPASAPVPAPVAAPVAPPAPAARVTPMPAPAAPAVPAVDPEEEALLKALEAKRAARAAAAAAAPVATLAPAPAPVAPSAVAPDATKMSDDDFLKLYSK